MFSHLHVVPSLIAWNFASCHAFPLVSYLIKNRNKFSLTFISISLCEEISFPSKSVAEFRLPNGSSLLIFIDVFFAGFF